jgi:long-chain fatty acid transport protein
MFPGDSLSFKGKGTSVGANVGLLWNPHQKWAFGAAYRSPSDLEYTGHSDAQPFGLRMDSFGVLRYPQFATAGISFRPNANWNIGFDFDWTDWDSVNTFVLRNTPAGNVPLILNWETSFIYKFGVTRQVSRGLWLGAGYFFSLWKPFPMARSPL